MKNIRQFFHVVSYLQYPILLVVFYYYFYFFKSIIAKDIDWLALNYVLLFAGINLSFATLQDPTKTQNKFSKRIWENPLKGKFALFVISLMVIVFFTLGILGLKRDTEHIHNEISFGLIVLGIGMMGLLKTAIEMFEHHRLDKNALDDL